MKLKPILSNFFGSFYGSNGIILILHSISKSLNSHQEGLTILPEKLKQILIEFKSLDYHFIGINDVETYLNTNKKFIVITLDDGYKDNYHAFYNVFKPLNIPITIYINDAFIEQQNYPWWITLSEAYANNKTECIRILETFNIQVSDNNSYYDIRNQVIQFNLLELNKLQIQLKGLTKQKPNLFLTKEDINNLLDEPLVTFGNHSSNHLNFNTLSNQEIYNEIYSTQQYFEKHFNSRLEHFSVPFGTKAECSKEKALFLETLGFKTVVSGRTGGLRKYHRNNLQFLPRYYIGNSSSVSSILFYMSGKGSFLKHSKSINIKY